ncbi:peptidase inhibitor family I36 protein [Kitasatospora sp. NPDC001527]|uniref:peptidase inhibitor family I36 protein n=1 Tax=Kitasatospora sp. NPDC001527 TaxID=3154519 RepID=UPI00332B93BD
MRSFRMLAVATAAAGALALAAPAATATPAPSAPAAPSADAQQPAGSTKATPSKPVIATYKGRQIDLAKGWDGARVCTEVTGGAVYCHDSVAEADAALATIDPALARATKAAKAAAPAAAANVVLSPQATSDCGSGWACLWEHANYSGSLLRWSQPGTKYLSDWSFRDMASSACVFRSGGDLTVYDDRTLQPDPSVYLWNGNCYDFTGLSYPYGGNWNDKADYIVL